MRLSGILLVELLCGALIGFLLALTGGWVGPWLTGRVSNGWNDLIASILGAFAGYMLGASLGVVVGGRLLGQQGVAWRAVLGSVLGGVAVMLLAEPLRLNRDSSVLMVSFALVALIGAVVGFQRWRKPAPDANFS